MIYQKWTDYEDEEAGIIPFTGSTPHNAITPICRKRSGVYEMDMVLRNNRTNQDFPDGVFHPHPETHHIKKENIGLIEVMGLAILPGRLKLELESIKEYVVHQTTLPKDCHYHQHWAIELKAKWNKKTPIDQFIQDEVGNKFLQAIQDAGVYKQTPDGLNQFNKFMEHCGFKIQ
jgi:UDPglucose--hexose-1-phosphate uridylyltransferase